MIEPMDIVMKAREYLGTPFHHQGRSKKYGIDCAGLLVCVGQELGFNMIDYTQYSRSPNPRYFIPALIKTMTEVSVEDARIGDWYCLWIKRPDVPQHLGMITPYGMIHAFSNNETKGHKVVEVRLDKYWSQRIHSCYRYREVV